MSFSSGTYSLYATGNPVVTNTTISSTWANNTLNDIATALSTCMLKDGTQTATASIGFAQGIDVTTAATTPSTTFACFNTNATTVNAFGAASVALNIGHASAAAAFAGGISTPAGKAATIGGLTDLSGASAGQIKFPATQNASADANTLDDYDEYTAASAACTGGVTATVVWTLVKVGKLITLSLPSTQSAGVAVAGFSYGTALPAKYRPSVTTDIPLITIDNNAIQANPGFIRINTNGVMTVYRETTAAGAWTVTANAGIPATSVAYTIM